MKNKARGSGLGHAVKLGKHSKVKAGPAYKMPPKSKMSQDKWATVRGPSQT